MKKTFLAIVALAFVASSASALSFSWSATKVAFDGNQLKNDTAITGYLIYLSSGSFDSSYTISESSTGNSVASSIGTLVSSASKTTAVAKIAGTASFDYGEYTNGDVFGLLLTYTGSDGKTYFNLSQTTYTLSGITSETSSPDAAAFTMSYSGPTEKTSVSSGGGWTAVPEPSTAALALAGLALLLKRRKA